MKDQLLSAAKVHNVVESKLKSSSDPITMRQFMEMTELAGIPEYRIKHAIDSIGKNNKGHLIKIPVVVVGQRSRLGYQWSEAGTVATAPDPKDNKPSKVIHQKVESTPSEDVRFIINKDKSITISMEKMRITIEIQK